MAARSKSSAPAEGAEVVDLATKKKSRSSAPKPTIDGVTMTVERSAMAAGLASVARAVGSPSMVPALGSVKLALGGDKATLTATDLDVVMTTTVPASDVGSGSMLVPARTIANVVSAVDGPVTLTLDGDQVVATSGKFEAKIRTQAVGDYPTIDPVGGDVMMMSAPALRMALALGLVAVSNDEARPILTSLLLTDDGRDHLRVVATDSYRLILVDVPQCKPVWGYSVLLPSKAAALAANIAARCDQVAIRTDGLRIEFRGDDSAVAARTREGEFPAYAKLLPESTPLSALVERKQLAAAVKRVRTLLDAERPIMLTFAAGTVTVSGGGESGGATEDVPAVFDGEQLKVAFNGQYLADGLNVIDGDTVTIGMTDELKPVVFSSETVKYLLMPVKQAG